MLERLDKDMIEAMKNKEQVRLTVIREIKREFEDKISEQHGDAGWIS